MCPDAATPLVAAAKRRHELTRAKAIQAIRELDRAGTAVTFTAVASQARVSRSWLCSQPDIRDQIRQLRQATGRSTTVPIPASQRASGTSLLRRLERAHAENRRLSAECAQLRAEITRLHRQIAHLLGEQRQAAVHARNTPPEPPRTTPFGNNQPPATGPHSPAAATSRSSSKTGKTRSQP